MSDNTLFIVGIGGCFIACVNAMMWLAQAFSERRWRFVGDGGEWSFKRMWLNLCLAFVFSLAAGAGMVWSS